MVDKRFYKIISPPLSISQIAKLIDVEIEGENNQDFLITSIAPLVEASSKDLSFLSNRKYLAEFERTKAGACIVSVDLNSRPNKNVILLKSKNPYLSYAKAINLFYNTNKNYSSNIMPSAIIASTAKLGYNCHIAHNVVIEQEVIIGDDSIIECGAFIDQGVVIGKRSKIGAGVTISHSIIGDDAIILPGARIGQEGFGFATHAGTHYKILHTGRVMIGNNVEIGANTTIDRGSMNDTIIKDNAHIDNLVQIGHNVNIGKGAVIAGQVGIAGSTQIGDNCVIGGQVGFAGHLKIGTGVQIAGGSGVGTDVPDKVVVGGYPAISIKDWHRQTIMMKNLINKEKNGSS